MDNKVIKRRFDPKRKPLSGHKYMAVCKNGEVVQVMWLNKWVEVKNSDNGVIKDLDSPVEFWT